MAIEKISDSAVSSTGVVSAADTLTGTAAENKEVFDKLPRLLRDKINEAIDVVNALSANDEISIKCNDGSLVWLRLNSDGAIEYSLDGSTWLATASSGHVILDAGGNVLPQRSRMQFAEGTVEDRDGVTVVHGVRGPQGEKGNKETRAKGASRVSEVNAVRRARLAREVRRAFRASRAHRAFAAHRAHRVRRAHRAKRAQMARTARRYTSRTFTAPSPHCETLFRTATTRCIRSRRTASATSGAKMRSTG